jgi:hypothetical protein
MEKDLNAIINDHRSGSTFLANKIIKVLGGTFINASMSRQETIVRKLLKAHSSLAAVINKLNWLCLKAEGEEIPLPGDTTEQIFHQFWKENKNRKTWILLSNSYWVTKLMSYGPPGLHLKIGLSHPDKEGMKTAEELKGTFKITVYEDCHLLNEVERSDGIILGADLISQDYFVNKIGSFGLGLAAKHFSKPLFVISSGDKFLTGELLPFFKLKVKNEGIQNIQYFEEVPLNLTTGIYLTSPEYRLPLSKLMKKLIPA